MYKGYTKNLLVTNTVTCGVLLAGGDFIQQKMEKFMGYSSNYDLNRTGRMFTVGLTQGPPHHYWYLWLDKFLPKTDLRTIIIKILADQFFAAPFFAITFFFGMGILEDKRMSECWKEFVKKFPAVYLVSNIYFFALAHSLFVIRIHLLTVRLVYLATYPVH